MRKSSLMFSLICGLGLFSTVNISVVVPGVFEVTCCSGTQYDAGEAFSGVRVELGIDDQLCGQALGLAYDGKYDVETVTRVAGPDFNGIVYFLTGKSNKVLMLECKATGDLDDSDSEDGFLGNLP